MDKTQDITQRKHLFSNEDISEPISNTDTTSVSLYGTLAFMMKKTEKDSFLDSEPSFFEEGGESKSKDFNQANTANLEDSNLQPMNIQFVDEHSLPGIGA